MELLQEIAVDSVGPQQCQRNPAARPVRVFRFNRPRVAVCAQSELRFDYQPLVSTF